MTEDVPDATLVHACLRDGRGGSPTAVLRDLSLSDHERRRVPALMGTSHAVFVAAHARNGMSASLRFFTSERELPACGHGTVAALAVLAGRVPSAPHDIVLHAAGRSFAGYALAGDAEGHCFAAFDPGPVEQREASSHARDLALRALGLSHDELSGAPCIASVGRARMLIPIATTSGLAALRPDQDRLRDACDELGLLGCYVYSPPTPRNRLSARMFAPAIGVPEDIANANSTACLATGLLHDDGDQITVDMGDALSAPASITAILRATDSRRRIYVGGTAAIGDAVRLSMLSKGAADAAQR